MEITGRNRKKGEESAQGERRYPKSYVLFLRKIK